MTVRLRTRVMFAFGMVAIGALSGCGPASSSTNSANRDVRRDAAVEAIEQTMPSVVSIATTTINEYHNPIQDWLARIYGAQPPTLRKEKRDTLGSGVIIDEAGYVITSYHVISNAYRVQVKLSSGDIYDLRPCVAGTQKDVAMFQIDAPPGKKFRAMKFANDDDLLLGESVVAVGNPFGLGGSVTRGILSSKNRRISSGNEPLSFQDWLQTDADINPGNSGGPLINMRGELIGLNVATGVGQGIGFAIPVKQVSATLSEFFTPEAANALWFGARVGSFNAPLTITFVEPASPAEKAGLQVGQRVIRVNGNRPRNLIEFQRLVTARPDLTAKIEIEFNSARRSITAQMIPFHDLILQRLGLGVRPMAPQETSDLQVKQGDALIVDAVEKDSPAEKAKLQPGFLITSMDDWRTGAMYYAGKAISGKKTGDRVQVSFFIPPGFSANFGEYNATLTVR